MVEICTRPGWIGIERRVHLFLFLDLIGEYLVDNPTVQTKKTKVSVFVGTGHGDHANIWKIFQVGMIPLARWDDFKDWCRDLGVDVNTVDIYTDQKSVSYPYVIDITTPADNDRLFYAKLRHL